MKKNKKIGFFFLNVINEKQMISQIPPTFKSIPGHLNPSVLLIISYFSIKNKTNILKKMIFFSLILLVSLIKLYEAKVRPVTVKGIISILD